MTWLSDSAARLSGGREDRCAIHETHAMDYAPIDLVMHKVPDVPRISLGWDQPVYLGESVEGYCTADQEVSRSIASQGVWEGFGTCLAAHLLNCDRSTVVDLGANVGWYTNLAGAFGHDVLAVDADPENVLAIEAGWWWNDWQGELAVARGWIGPESPCLAPYEIRFVKIDIEGSERHLFRLFGASFQMIQPPIEFIMAEVSPTFGPIDWVYGLCEYGYRAYLIPDKQVPPEMFADDPLGMTLDWGPLVAHEISDQADVLFVREDLL